MDSASIISIAAGRTPAAMMSDTAWPPSAVEEYAASSVCTTSGSGISLTTILVTMPSVPSEPVNAPSRSYPVVTPVPSPSQVSSPDGVTISRPVTWCTVNPCLRQCAPPEFSATLPPTEQTTWLDGSGA
jgi:hypothetical protein